MAHYLYLDCSCGISGDMTVAALLDLGADEQVLRDALASLPLDGYQIAITRVKKSGIDACDFNVILDQDNHDHDMAWLHGDGHHHHEHEHADAQHHHEHEHDDAQHHHEHEHEHDGAHHHHEHEHEHDGAHYHHEHEHEHDGAHHHHEHKHEHDGAHHHHDHPHHGRGLPEITEILEAGNLTPGALALAKKIFRIVAEAEAHVHGRPVDEVHFHEVGAVDSIVDIASIAVCMDNLGIDRVVIPALTEGTGMVRCQHGLLPIPVPATAQITAAHHLPLRISSVAGELVTPTGAAVAAAVITDRELPETFEIERIGIGAGKRDYANAGILRAMRIHSDDRRADTILKLETNIDDCTGETIGFVSEELMNAGALDVFQTPIYMKKNRPAVLLSVLCRPEDRARMETLIFRHTTTIGIRCQRMERTKLEREAGTVETPWGTARIKYIREDDGLRAYPEADSTAELARISGAGYAEMYHHLKELASK